MNKGRQKFNPSFAAVLVLLAVKFIKTSFVVVKHLLKPVFYRGLNALQLQRSPLCIAAKQDRGSLRSLRFSCSLLHYHG